MTEADEKLIYRPKRRDRWLIAGTMAAALLFWLGIFLFLIVNVAHPLADSPEIFGEDLTRYLWLFTGSFSMATVAVIALTVYVTAYWWTFRVELDDHSIARRGLPYPVNPRFSLALQDIERIAAGSRYSLRVIPIEGKVAVLNVKMVEDGLSGMVGELTRRLSPEKVQPDLEQQLAAMQRSRVDLIVGLAGGVMAIFLFASLAFDRPLKTLFAWELLGGRNDQVLALSIAPDGALWTLREGDRGPDLLGVELHRFLGDESTVIDLPAADEAPGGGAMDEFFRSPVRGMTVISDQQAWMIGRTGATLSKWDGESWQRTDIPHLGPRPDIDELALLAGNIWGFSRFARIGFSIDAGTGDVSAFEFVQPGEVPETALRLNPTDFQTTSDGGLMITGYSPDGQPGIIHMTSNGEIDVMTSLEGLVDLPDSTWSLDLASADAEHNLYTIFTSPNGCAGSTYQAIVGIFDRAAQEWSTIKLDRPVNCSSYRSLPSFAIDPMGRIWMAMKAQRGAGVTVHDPRGRASGIEQPLHPVRHYTEDNSAYNGEPIASDRGGVIYAIDEFGQSVAIDGSAVELPAPMPPALAFVWSRSYVVFTPYLVLVLVLWLRTIRRDRRREDGGSRQPTGPAAPPDAADTPHELIFRQTSRYRRGTLYLSIALPLIILMAFLVIPIVAGQSPGDVFELTPWPLLLLLLAAPLVLGAALVYWAVFASKDRLVISPTQMERRGLHHFRIYRGPVRFGEVAKVRRRGRGVVAIEREQGRTFEFAPRAYEGPGEIVVELRKRIPPDRFEADLDEGLHRRTSSDYRALPFFIAGGLLYFFGLFHDGAIDKVREDLAWTTEVKAAAIRESIEGFDLQADGSLWLLVRNKLGDYQDPRNYEVQHVTATGTETIAFPGQEVLFPQGPPDLGGTRPSAVRVTDEGVPRVYMFLLDTPLVWTGNRWEWEPERESSGVQPPADEDSPTEQVDIRQSLLSAGSLTATIPSSGSTEHIDFVPEADRASFIIEGQPYGWTLARYRSPDGRLFLMPFREDSGEGHWAEFEISGLDLGEYWSVADYTVGPTGAVYALARSPDYCPEDEVVLFVGRLEAAASEPWKWRELNYPEDCDRPGNPDQLVVDAKGRLLVQEWQQVAMYDSAIFDKPVAEPQDLVIYTEGNSGFYGGHSLKIGPDGRIWSLETLGEALVWFDPSVDDLPNPLPAWVDALYGSVWTTLVFMLAGSVVYVVGIRVTRG